MPFPHHRKRGRGDNDGVLHAADHDTWNAAKTKSWSALWDLSNFFVGGKGYCFCWSSSWKKETSRLWGGWFFMSSRCVFEDGTEDTSKNQASWDLQKKPPKPCDNSWGKKGWWNLVTKKVLRAQRDQKSSRLHKVPPRYFAVPIL